MTTTTTTRRAYDQRALCHPPGAILLPPCFDGGWPNRQRSIGGGGEAHPQARRRRGRPGTAEITMPSSQAMEKRGRKNNKWGVCYFCIAHRSRNASTHVCNAQFAFSARKTNSVHL
ncbi:hypothetical protein CPB86DRAFT_381190 [Serendipita vermifera]|nr:hypothetical protein CPB86DRAFT_381190 [Serendipita vermifera]